MVLCCLGITITEHVDSAEISVPSPLPIRIDKNLRKALLKALEKLDEDDPGTVESRESRESKNENEDELLDTSTDKNDEDDSEAHFEKLPINVKEIEDDEEFNANIFLQTVNADLSKRDDAPTKISVTTNPKNNLKINEKNNSKTYLNSISSTPRVDVTNRGNTLVTSVKSIAEAITVTEKTSLSSPNPTVSTPVDEDQTNVKVEDVQFIHAPLVAAFTVQQDEKGLPQKVIPLFGSKTQSKSTQAPKENFVTKVQSLEEKQRALEQQIQYLQEKRKQEEILLKQQELLLNQQEQLKKQNEKKSNNFQEQLLPLQTNSISFNSDANKLEEERRAQVLKQQLPSQESFSFNTGNVIQHDIPKTVLPLQHLPLQQNPISFNSFGPLQTNVDIQKAQNLPVLSTVQQPVLGQQNLFSNGFKPQNLNSQSSITIQPSLSFQPSRFTQGIVPSTSSFNTLDYSGQLPPFREAINFNQPANVPFFTQTRNNVFSKQQLPLQFSFSDNYVQDTLRTQLPPLPPHQSTRVFRHETQTGNFGITDLNRNRFNQHQFANNFNTVETVRSNGVYVNNRPFDVRGQFFNGHNQISIDDRLKKLFYQSGFGQGRSQEDINIVSKVLALDHTR